MVQLFKINLRKIWPNEWKNPILASTELSGKLKPFMQILWGSLENKALWQIQILVTEIYKTKNDFGPKIMKDTFHFIQKPYNLRNDPELQRRRATRT